MDWTEVAAPLALIGAPWPGGDQSPIKLLFDGMFQRLRCITLHYLRGDVNRVGHAATEQARLWAFEYGALAEEVSPHPLQ